MEFDMDVERAGEKILDTVVAEHGEEAPLYLAKLVAALTNGRESDYFQANEETRRLFNSWSNG